MAQQKSINVKVTTAKVIEALEKSLASRKKIMSDYEKSGQAHEKAVADWEKSVIEYVKSGKAKATEVTHNVNWRNDTKEARIVITLPASLVCPEKPDTPREVWNLNSEIEELENAIALLKMTDEEYVSTSTYRGVSRLIK